MFFNRFNRQEGSVKEWKDMLDVNVVGLTQTTQLAIKSMLKVKISHFRLVTLNYCNFGVKRHPIFAARGE